MKDDPKSSVPVPDPTELTTESLKLAIANLKELVLSKIDATNTLKEEKFKELHERLDLIEARRIELKQDNQQALQAALKAQETLFRQQNQCNEEAAEKAETSFAKQLEAISKENTLGREALSGRLDALKERIDRGAGKETAAESQGMRSRERSSWVIPVVVVSIIAILNLLLNLVQMLLSYPK